MHYRVYLVFLFSVVMMVCCYGQKKINQADSLRTLLNRPDDSVKVDLLNAYALQIRDGDNLTALEWSLKSKNLAIKLGYQKGLASALANIGWIYYRQSDFPAALESTTQSLAISESSKDDAGMGSGYNNLGAIYVEQKDYPSALQTFRKALMWGKKAGDIFTIGRSYNNMAYVFLLAKELDSAEYYSNEGIRNTSGYSIGFAWRTLGDINAEKKNSEKAEIDYLKSIAIADSNKNYSLKVSTVHRLGKLYAGNRQAAKAIRILKENEKLCKTFKFRNELANTYKVLASLFSQTSDFANSSVYFQKYIDLNDSLYNETRNKQIALLEDKYNRVRINLLTKENELKDRELNAERLRTWISFGGLVAFVGLAFVLYYNNRRIRIINEQLEFKNKEVIERGEELKAQAETLTQSNTTKDKLFSIISHDLRGPLNSLSGLLQLAERGFVKEDEFRIHIGELSKNTNRTKELLNNLLFWSSAQLKNEKPKPQRFDFVALTNSVILLYEKRFHEKGIRVVNGLSELSVWADADMIAVVLRNLISNALKFSKSGGVITIGNEVENQHVKFFVKDEGVGLSKEMMDRLFSGEMVSTKGTENEVGTGLGIQLCIDFIDKSGGRLWVSSTEGGGSTFWFTLPLPV